MLKSIGKRFGVGLSEEEKEKTRVKRSEKHEEKLESLQRRLELTQARGEVSEERGAMQEKKIGLQTRKTELGLKQAQVGLQKAKIQKMRQQSMPRMPSMDGATGPTQGARPESVKMPSVDQIFFPSTHPMKKESTPIHKKKHKKKKRYKTIKVPY